MEGGTSFASVPNLHREEAELDGDVPAVLVDQQIVKCGHTSRLEQDQDSVALQWSSLKHSLICPLCEGLFRDAHTISECLHTFCKTCISHHFQSKTSREAIECPSCKTALGSIHSVWSKLLFDRNLQSIVDKIFPQFAEQDQKELAMLFQTKKRSLETSKHPASHSSSDNAVAKKLKSDPGAAPRAAPSNASTIEFMVTVVPDISCEASLQLPPITKPSFRGMLSTKVLKVQSFISKRVAESIPSISKDEVAVLWKGEQLKPMDDLSALRMDPALASSAIELVYRRHSS